MELCSLVEDKFLNGITFKNVQYDPDDKTDTDYLKMNIFDFTINARRVTTFGNRTQRIEYSLVGMTYINEGEVFRILDTYGSRAFDAYTNIGRLVNNNNATIEINRKKIKSILKLLHKSGEDIENLVYELLTLKDKFQTEIEELQSNNMLLNEKRSILYTAYEQNSEVSTYLAFAIKGLKKC